MLSNEYSLYQFRVESVEATSPQIESIDQAFIDVIKRRQIQAMRSTAKAEANKSLYTIEEVAKNSEEALTGIFNYSINDIIQVLTDNYKHRNSQQIKLLSELHKANEETVRLTLKPLFGFVFFLEGQENFHHVWELLDSHATYIWSYAKSSITRKEALDKVEYSINEIHEIKRNAYKVNNRTNNHFSYLEHKLAEDGISVLFEQWRTELERIIKSYPPF